ncbi:MAG: branched-chain amino acid ABC transporter ATP-binding protein/permease [Roseiarcus sp.]
MIVWFAPLVLGAFAVNVLTRSMLYATLAVTVDLLWGFTGILTFGQAAFFGVGAYATAMTMTSLGSTPVWIAAALGLAIVLPVILGVLVGWLSFYHGSTPLYASVISLVFPIVVTQLVYSGGALTGSSSGLVGYDTLPLDLEGFFRLSGLVMVVATVAAWIFVRSDAGKLLVAVRDNDLRCAYLGVSPKRVQIALTAVLAGVAGAVGFLFAHASGVVAPENTGFLFGTQLVIWVALGGRASLLGPVIGTLAIDYLSASLSGDLPFLWQLVLGASFVIIIILLPDGLAGLARRALAAAFGAPNEARSPSVAVAANAPRAALGQAPLLSVSSLARSFGSLSVLTDINFEIRPGELVSIVGPNGAGKTTLIRCLSDGSEPFKGTVEIEGRPTMGLTPDRIVALGVGRKFQVASIFESLTVADCLRLARTTSETPSGIHSAAALTLPASSVEILRLTGLADLMASPARLLSHGMKQALELAMVLALEPKLILLDEPTAGLSKTERATIGAVLKQLVESGFAIILVEHDLDFVREISSRIVVLHQGRLVLDGDVDEVVNSETVRTIYAGGGHV